MFLILAFCAIFVVINAGDSDPVLTNMLEKASTNGDGFAYAFSGGSPQNFFPQNAFLGGAMPIADFLQNLQKQQAEFESGILNWASNPGDKPFLPMAGIPENLGRDAEAAFAGAAISPGGVYQTAQIFPENANSPNIETRFASSNPSPDGGNFYSVITSSQAGSQTVDGKTTGYRKATTTVNDNGKVTTYTAKNP